MQFFPISLFLLLIFVGGAYGLHCIQCGNTDNWYSEKEQAKRSSECNSGMIQPTLCANSSHTVCIVDWYSNGGNGRVVTKRHCGMETDVKGCTLYNSKITKKHRRHIITRDTTATNTPAHRQESIHTYVEVCSGACPLGDCGTNSATYKNFQNIFGFSLILLILHTLSY